MIEVYLSPMTESVEPDSEMIWLYELFGDQDNVILQMHYFTFKHLLNIVNCNCQEPIFQKQTQYLYGYRININITCPDCIIYVSSIIENFS